MSSTATKKDSSHDRTRKRGGDSTTGQVCPLRSDFAAVLSWGLRKYSGDQGRIWNGDPECEHEWGPLGPAHHPGQVPQTKTGNSDASVEGQNAATGQYCSRCGAWCGSLGLEPTPEQHVENIVEICREVRRVLRDDGVFFLNYGDSYFGDSPVRTSGAEAFSKTWDKSQTASRGGNRRSAARRAGFQPGSLSLMPHRVAIALAEDGWIIRQDLVWYKRNPMPESLAGTRWIKHRIKEKRSKHASDHNIKGGTEAMLRDASIHQGIDEDWVPEYVDCPGCDECDPNDGYVLRKGSFRHTRAHEYVFMLTKKMQYWSNQEAVREGLQQSSIDRINQETFHEQTGGEKDYKHGTNSNRSMRKTLENFAESRAGRNPRSVLDVPTDSMEVFYHWIGERTGLDLHELIAAFQNEMSNPGDVLDVPTAPYKGAHYATFPPNLIAPLIRATCPRWACPVCGQGWAAVVEKGGVTSRGGSANPNRAVLTSGTHFDHGQKQTEFIARENSVLGYRPTCEHPHTQEEALPGIVFDPFLGSGTSVAVAKQLLRRGIGIDISMEYLDQQAKVRAGLGTPSNALDDLPLFSSNEPTPQVRSGTS